MTHAVSPDLVQAIHDALPPAQTMTADEMAAAVGGRRWAPGTIRQALAWMAERDMIVAHRGKAAVRYGRHGAAPNPETPGGWSDEAVERLRALWATNRSASEIAAELGPAVTKNAVIGKAKRIGLPARPSPIVREGVMVGDRRCNVTLAATLADGCRWPVGEDAKGRHLFCNRKAHRPGSAWCEKHRAQVYDRAGKNIEELAAAAE